MGWGVGSVGGGGVRVLSRPSHTRCRCWWHFCLLFHLWFVCELCGEFFFFSCSTLVFVCMCFFFFFLHFLLNFSDCDRKTVGERQERERER